MCVCVCGGGGGYSDIFIYIRRLGPFLGFKILNFNFFFFFFFFWGGGGVRNIIIFRGMKILWIYHYKTGLVLGVISIHFRVFFLRSMCRMRILFGVAQNYKYFLGSG